MSLNSGLFTRMPVDSLTVCVEVFTVLTDWLLLTSNPTLPLIPKPSMLALAATDTETSVEWLLTEPLLWLLPEPCDQVVV
jgi:hypothetical protein